MAAAKIELDFFTLKYNNIYSKGLKTAELKEKDMPMVLDKTIIYIIS